MFLHGYGTQRLWWRERHSGALALAELAFGYAASSASRALAMAAAARAPSAGKRFPSKRRQAGARHRQGRAGRKCSESTRVFWKELL